MTNVSPFDILHLPFMNIVVMGPQGSGKSTQAELLAKKLRLPHVSTGDIFREIAKRDSELGHRISEKLSHGEMVDDADIMKVVGEHLAQSKFSNGFVLDGFPRNLYQAQNSNHPVNQVFHLKVSDKEGIKRLLKRGRADDSLKTISARLRLYHKLTEPVLTFYREKGILQEINGEQSIKKIHQEILSHL